MGDPEFLWDRATLHGAIKQKQREVYLFSRRPGWPSFSAIQVEIGDPFRRAEPSRTQGRESSCARRCRAVRLIWLPGASSAPGGLLLGRSDSQPLVRNQRHHESDGCGDGSASRCAWSRHASRSLRMSSSIAFNTDSRSSAWAVRCCAIAMAAASPVACRGIASVPAAASATGGYTL